MERALFVVSVSLQENISSNAVLEFSNNLWGLGTEKE
jgi:hypothetical protein